MTRNVIKTAGFTLIELMLVIAIMALITSFGVMMVRKHAESERLNKTALQMQGILQAAMAYDVDQDDWPDELPCDGSGTVTDLFLQYLPNQTVQSNFGGNYCWGTNASHKLFWVALKFPGTDRLMVERIAAQLPNAYAVTDPDTNNPKNDLCETDSSDCYVRAEIAQPGITSNQQAGHIVGSGDCKPISGTQPGSSEGTQCVQGSVDSNLDQVYAIDFSCQPGEQGGLIVMPNFLKMPKVDINRSLSNSMGEYSIATNSCISATGGNTSCTISVRATYNNTYCPNSAAAPISIFKSCSDVLVAGHVGASYIAYCEKSGG